MADDQVTGERLESWKEIAAYLKRDESTVRRWEHTEGLPVRRHRHLARSSVYAYPSELDAWREGRRPAGSVEPVRPPKTVRLASIAAALVIALLSAGGGRFVGPVAAEGQPVAGDMSGQATTATKVWTGPGVDAEGTISPDGKFLSYTDWSTGNLALHDLATGKDRPLTDGGGLAHPDPAVRRTSEEFAEESAISRDGRQVAYSWFNGHGRYELRITATQGAVTPPHQLYDNPDVLWIGPYDWSPDGRWIAVAIEREDHTQQLGLVSTTEINKLVVLKTTDWEGSSTLKFSPDGRLLAFDARQELHGRVSHHVFALAIGDPGHAQQTTIVDHDSNNKLVGWSPDGRWLLFSSDRRGTNDLWATPVKDGVRQGEPRLLESDFGGWSMGITTSGTLAFGLRMSTRDVSVSTIDLSTGQVGKPIHPIPTYMGTNSFPTWSSDGNTLVAVSRNRPEATPVLAFRDMDSGQLREVPVQLRYVTGPRMSPDGKSLITQGIDRLGRQGIFRIDVGTGTAEPVDVSATERPGPRKSEWSPDGGSIFYYRGTTDDAADGTITWVLVKRTLASGETRELLRKVGGLGPGGLAVSPDGRVVAAVRDGAILVIPVDGGPARTVAHPQPPARFAAGVLNWTPDGREIVVGTRESATAPMQLALIPIDGSPSTRRITLQISKPAFGFGPLHLSPDGRRMTYVSGENAFEVWTLEHFLPRDAVR